MVLDYFLSIYDVLDSRFYLLIFCQAEARLKVSYEAKANIKDMMFMSCN